MSEASYPQIIVVGERTHALTRRAADQAARYLDDVLSLLAEGAARTDIKAKCARARAAIAAVTSSNEERS